LATAPIFDCPNIIAKFYAFVKGIKSNLSKEFKVFSKKAEFIKKIEVQHISAPLFAYYRNVL